MPCNDAKQLCLPILTSIYYNFTFTIPTARNEFTIPPQNTVPPIPNRWNERKYPIKCLLLLWMFAIVERALGGWACLLFLLSYALFGIDTLALSCHAHVNLSTKTTPRSRSVVCCCLYFIFFVLPMYSHCHRPFVRSSLSSSKSPGYFVFVWLFMCRFLFALLLVLLLWSVGWSVVIIVVGWVRSCCVLWLNLLCSC